MCKRGLKGPNSWGQKVLFLSLFEWEDDKKSLPLKKCFNLNFSKKKIHSFVWFCQILHPSFKVFKWLDSLKFFHSPPIWLAGFQHHIQQYTNVPNKKPRGQISKSYQRYAGSSSFIITLLCRTFWRGPQFLHPMVFWNLRWYILKHFFQRYKLIFIISSINLKNTTFFHNSTLLTHPILSCVNRHFWGMRPCCNGRKAIRGVYTCCRKIKNKRMRT